MAMSPDAVEAYRRVIALLEERQKTQPPAGRTVSLLESLIDEIKALCPTSSSQR